MKICGVNFLILCMALSKTFTSFKDLFYFFITFHVDSIKNNMTVKVLWMFICHVQITIFQRGCMHGTSTRFN